MAYEVVEDLIKRPANTLFSLYSLQIICFFCREEQVSQYSDRSAPWPFRQYIHVAYTLHSMMLILRYEINDRQVLSLSKRNPLLVSLLGIFKKLYDGDCKEMEYTTILNHICHFIDNHHSFLS